LDVPSRDILKDIVSRTLRGFTNDILVQGVSSKATAKTQILLSTHRAEEIVDDIDQYILWKQQHDENNINNNNALQVLTRQNDNNDDDNMAATVVSAQEALYKAMNIEEVYQPDNPQFVQLDWNDPTMPSHEEVKKWWNYGSNDDESNDDVNTDILVHANDLSIHRGGNTLLHNLHWTVIRGQRWIVGGGNGAGKSTLSRLLAIPDNQIDETKLQILPNASTDNRRSQTVGWVSTESHLKWHEQTKTKAEDGGDDLTVEEFLLEETHTASWDDVIAPVLSWLDMADIDRRRAFRELSQGQQKLLLIGCAIAQRPPLLVLDEPCQGLDVVKRRLLLKVLERICSATNISLIYITHHLDEELIPSISHAIHLKDRQAVYQGPIEKYQPKDFYTTKTTTTTTSTGK
jgi:ABC-type molybdenum transport system ATPase subunit/photorepair protein PhrA